MDVTSPDSFYPLPSESFMGAGVTLRCRYGHVRLSGKNCATCNREAGKRFRNRKKVKVDTDDGYLPATEGYRDGPIWTLLAAHGYLEKKKPLTKPSALGLFYTGP